jgi:GDPmannose 4,6-dehydratase
VRVDPKYFRPTEVETLLGDPSKAMNALGWKPAYPFQAMVLEMVEEDLKDASREVFIRSNGYDVHASCEALI